MAAPELKVVTGDWEACSAWLDFPAQVVGRGLNDKSTTVNFRVGKEDAVKAARQARRTLVFEFWSIVFGAPPPVPGAPEQDIALSSLLDAHACFKGMKRPFGSDENGDNFIVYILKPKFQYIYRPSMKCLAHMEAVRSGLVFAVYARLDEPFSEARSSAIGILTHWHFIRADAYECELPVDHAARYGQRLW